MGRITPVEYEAWLTENRPEIETLESYVNDATRIHHKCRRCAGIWSAVPNSIKRGSGCPSCSGTMKQTPKEYRAWLRQNRSNVRALEDYVTANTKIPHQCQTCNRTWDITPSKIKFGRGCPFCAGLFSPTPEQYQHWLNNNSELTALENYVNSKTKIKHQCLTCLHTWLVQPNSIKQGTRCPKCAGSLKQTPNLYREWLNENTEISVLEDYVKSNIKIKHQCLKCLYIWRTLPSSIKSGTGCPSCSGSLKLTPSQYRNWLAENRSEIDTLEDYVTARTKIKHQCQICSHCWPVTPSHIKRGNGCPYCAQNIKVTPEQYKTWLEQNTNITALNEYTSSRDVIHHQCISCSYIWLAMPSNIINRGSRCPKCAGNVKQNPKQYRNWLKDNRPTIRNLEDYVTALTKVRHQCLTCDYVWSVAPSKIKTNRGCPSCAGNLRHSPKQYREWLLENTKLKTLEDFKGSRIKISHQCLKCSHSWSALPMNIKRGRGCPSCSVSGFDPAKTGCFYVLGAYYKEELIYKIGITNFNAEARHGKKTFKLGWQILAEIFYPVGADAEQVEKITKKVMKPYRFECTAILLPRGGHSEIFTEPPSNIQLNLMPMDSQISLIPFDS